MRKIVYSSVMIYQYLAGIDRNLAGLSFIAVIGSIIAMRRFTSWGGLLVGLAIAYILIDKSKHTGNAFIEKMEAALQSQLLSDTNHMYLDPNLINLLVEMRIDYERNPVVYNQIKLMIDRILGNSRLAEVSANDLVNTLEESMNLFERIKTLMHNLGQNLVDDDIDRHNSNYSSMISLLNQHLDKIYKRTGDYYRQNGITSTTKFVYPHHPKAYSLTPSSIGESIL